MFTTVREDQQSRGVRMAMMRLEGEAEVRRRAEAVKMRTVCVACAGLVLARGEWINLYSLWCTWQVNSFMRPPERTEHHDDVTAATLFVGLASMHPHELPRCSLRLRSLFINFGIISWSSTYARCFASLPRLPAADNAVAPSIIM